VLSFNISLKGRRKTKGRGYKKRLEGDGRERGMDEKEKEKCLKKNRGGKRGCYPTIFRCFRRLRLPMAVRPIISPEQRRLL